MIDDSWIGEVVAEAVARNNQRFKPTPQTGNILGHPGVPQYKPDLNDLFLRGRSTFIPINYGMSVDPLLETGALMKKLEEANKALSVDSIDFTKRLLGPAFEMVRRDVGEQAGQMKADLISDAVRRNIVGGSTLEGQVTREVPEFAAKALADAETNLLLQGIPIAQREKQMTAEGMFRGVDVGMSLRKLVGDEHLSKMSFEQRERFTKADQDMQFQIKQIDQDFAERMQQAQFAFQTAENEKDRKIAEAQYQQLLAERREAREGAFLSGLTSLVGLGLGMYMGGPGGRLAGGMLGLLGGKTAGDSLGFLF